MATTNELDALLESSKSDRLIKIYTGSAESSDRPYLIQQTTLENASEYFIKALKHETALGDEPGVLRFKEDDQEAWTILIFWLLKGTLPSVVRQPNEPTMLLIKCWTLGDKYLTPYFQDSVMLELLRIVDKQKNFDLSHAEAAMRCSTTGSALRQLAMEEVVCWLWMAVIEPEDLECLNGIPGILTSIGKVTDEAVDRHRNDNTSPDEWRLRTNPDSREFLWKKYMVSAQPMHWIWGGKDWRKAAHWSDE